MPIGTSKLGVLGAGLVPGGSVTFNASGTFSVPPGVKKVSITGKGGTGNPGNAGNPGNPGQSGSGGAGGGGGQSRSTCYCTGQFNQILGGSRGGWASRPDMASRGSITLTPAINNPPSIFQCWIAAGTAPPTYVNQVSVGGYQNNSAQSGQSGGAGTAGNAGNPGNTGASSSGLGNTFPGGAGGNAGVGGSAGNGGSGGSGGSVGGQAPLNSNAGVSGGSGGNGGGPGGNGSYHPGPGCSIGGFGGAGGGGAGATNSGFSGENSKLGYTSQLTARGGEDSQVSAPYQFRSGIPAFTPATSPANGLPSNTMGGYGGIASAACTDSYGSNAIRFGKSSSINCGGYNNACPDRSPSRVNFPQFNPAPLAPNIIRAGGGGAAAGYTSNILQFRGGGGGGGGGRGNAGNAGGNSSAPSGSAATPQTFNCVPVTPGGSAPITVAAPGGQVVISWNPQ